MLAPTDLSGQNPRPDLRPHVVNNSWGSNNGADTFFQATVQAWLASGIFPAFATGNAGPSCNTVGSPASYPESYGVGAFDINNAIAGFSSRGAAPASVGGEIKPNIAAPGVNVRSSLNNSDYGVLSGTSMATPHTAATVALMWSAAPVLVGDVAQTRALLDQTAIDVSDLTCGGTAADNNVWGEGRLDAFAAVDQSPRGSTGTLTGTVTDAATSAAISGATVTATGPVTRTVTTDAAGQYSLRLPIGSYDVTARAFGYVDQTVSGVVISENLTTTQNFALTSMPRGTLQGIVTDAGSGRPIAGATVEAVGSTGMLTVLTDANGQYNFPDLPVGSYDVTARAFGYFDQTASGVIINQGQTTIQNLALSTTGLWTATGNMTVALGGPSAIRLNDGRVLYVSRASATTSAATIYDPTTRTWSSTGAPTAGLGLRATRLADGRVLAAGGFDAFGTPLSNADIYDPATGTWSPTASMSVARNGHTLTLLNDGRVLAAGGFDGTSQLSSAEIYNPTTGTWSPTGSMSDIRSGGQTANLLTSGRVLVAGGFDANGNPQSSTETYDPTTGTWSSAGSMSVARANHTATLLNDGRVLAAAGSADLFDPVTGTWSPTGSMTETRSEHVATLLGNGLVLAAGGFGGLDDFGTPISRKSAELFDPATGRWTRTRDMSIGRRGGSIALLADGQVLVAGGAGTSAELFDLPPDLLEGTVTDASTGAPIAGATIEVSGPFAVTDLTDADGFYSLLLQPGTFDVAARAFGYVEQTASGVIINQDQTTIRNFALMPVQAHSVSGHVRDASGAPIANATVTILSTQIPPATTDTAGFYSFASVPEGTYTVEAPGPVQCFAPQQQTLIVAGGPAILDFTLEQRSDSFGYTCRLVAPAYIEATNVLSLTNNDVGNATVTLPFAFSFYSQSHTTAFVWADGVLNFVWPGGSPNSAIPNEAAPNGAIYPFWDDLFVCNFCNPPTSVRSQVLGTAPDRRFVIEWRNVYIKPTSSNRQLDVEVVLFENGQILFQYRNIDAADGLEQGNSATIGIENQAGTVAFQYSFNEAVLTNETAILFQAGGGPLPTPTPTPTPLPAASITVIAPNGGEVWQIGSTQTIQWNAQGVTGNVKIQLSRDGGASFKQIANNVPNTGTFQWTVTKPATTQALIRVISMDQPDVQNTSDSVFSITR